MKKILLATDGSESSLHAARVAGELASLKNGQVIVLYVAHVPAPTTPPMSSATR